MPTVASPRSPRARFHIRLGLIVLAGLAVRLVYVALSHRVVGTGDSAFYHETANILARGEGYLNYFALRFGQHTPTALHPPLVPVYLALFSKLGATSYVAHRVATCLLGAVALLVLGHLGRAVGGPRVGLAAAALGAAYPVLVAADGTVMSETAFGLLATLCVLLAYRMRETAAPPSARLALAFGVAVGAAALARPEGLALLLLLLLVPGVRGAGRPGTARAALALAATAIVLAPWMIHLWATFGRPVPLAVNGSTLVAGANCRQTYGGPHIGSWDFDCVSRVPRRNDVVAAGAELRRGAAYAAHHVGELPLVVLARLGRTFDLFQPGHEERVAEGRAPALSRVGAVVFWLLMPLGAYGAVVLRRRRRPLGPLWVPVGLVLLVTVAGYGIPRFRHPAEFTLLVLAAAGLVELVERRAAQRAVPGAKTRASGVS